MRHIFFYCGLIVLIIFAIMACIALWPQVGFAHDPEAPVAAGETFWATPYKNSAGVSCCGEHDMVFVPHWMMAGKRVGDQITVNFPAYGRQTITIQKIYPTRDPKGRAAITFYGCAFKAFAM